MLLGGGELSGVPNGDAAGDAAGDADEARRLLCEVAGRLLGLSGAVRADARFGESGGSSVLAARLGFELKRLGWHLSTEALLRPDATMASAAP